MNLPIDQLFCGDAVELSRRKLPDCSIDGIATDPPYGLEFMGEKWDKFKKVESIYNPKMKMKRYTSGKPRAKDNPWEKVATSYGMQKKNPRCRKCGRFRFDYEKNKCCCEQPDFDFRTAEYPRDYQKWTTSWAKEAYRVLKPGASMLVMGGTRTYHRMACGVEDAGFLIKDCLVWCYNSGFPKSQDLGAMFDKQECRRQLERRLGRKPTKAEFKKAWKKFREVTGVYQSPSDNAKRNYGNLACESVFGIGEGDFKREITTPTTDLTKKWNGWKVGGLKPSYEPVLWAVKPPEGSWTDNVLKHGVGAINVDGCRIPTNENLGRPSGTMPHPMDWGNIDKIPYKDNSRDKGRYPANMIRTDRFHDGYDRFYFVPKASKSERELGLEDFDAKQVMNFGHKENPGRNAPKKSYPHKNIHPTVKPVRLMECLIRLVTREGQIVLDPFVGSGTTCIAARRLNRHYIGFDNNPDYIEIARHRLAAIPRPLEAYGG